jgi:hypothetical protein
MEGFEPLARWRVHAIAAEVYRAGEDARASEHHHELSRATIFKLPIRWRQKSRLGRLSCQRLLFVGCSGTPSLPMVCAQGPTRHGRGPASQWHAAHNFTTARLTKPFDDRNRSSGFWLTVMRPRSG